MEDHDIDCRIAAREDAAEEGVGVAHPAYEASAESWVAWEIKNEAAIAQALDDERLKCRCGEDFR